MLEFLSKWIPRTTSAAQAQPEDQRAEDDGQHLPFPATERSVRGTAESPLTAARPPISAPLTHPSYSLTGFDSVDYAREQQQQHFPYSTGRSGPSSLSWLNSNSSSSLNSSERIPSLPWPQPPQVVRLPDHALRTPIPLQRSNSSVSIDGSTSGSSTLMQDYRRGSPKAQLKLNTNPDFSRSSQSLQLEPHQPSSSLATQDVYGNSYNYPLAKQLSPIPEQDYFSPDSLRKTTTLPGGAGPSLSMHSVVASIGSGNTVMAPSPGESFVSEITRPSPSYSNSHPFLTRQLNRTVSQTSSRTLESVISSTRPTPSTPATPSAPSAVNSSSSTIPPINIPPPYPSHSVTPLRTRRSMVETMPTINSSGESAIYPDDPDDSVYRRHSDLESLHADSFVTASETSPSADLDTREITQDSRADETADISMIRSETSGVDMEDVAEAGEAVEPVERRETQVPSVSESFVSRRWNRDAELGPGGAVVTLNAKRQQLFSKSTPAFWTFWLGFVLPPLWLVGGWHFTRYGEQPARLTFWEFYFNTKFWKDFMHGKIRCLCCGQGKMVVRRVSWFKQQDGGIGVTELPLHTSQMPPTPLLPALTGNEPKKSVIAHRLPRWITEKQSSDDGRARLNDPKRSLRGISFGYPFIPRPLRIRRRTSDSQKNTLMCAQISHILGRPNRLLDQMYGVKLTEVRGRPESGRRIIDPWIQRCRYAFCWALILVCIASCILSVYLIIYNTRQFR